MERGIWDVEDQAHDGLDRREHLRCGFGLPGSVCAG